MWLRTGDGRDKHILFGEPVPSEFSDEVLDLALNDIVEGDPTFDALARTGVVGPAMRRRDRAIATMWTLLFMEESLSRRAVESVPYKDLAVADVLLHESEKQALLGRPETSERMARVASWITDQAFPEQLELSEGLRLRTRCLLGNARRLSGDWHGAEDCFVRALSFLMGSPTRDKAFFYQMLAGLREEQKRFEEALALLGRAVVCLGGKQVEPSDLLRPRFLVAFDPRRNSCLTRMGFIHLKRGDPGSALSAFMLVEGGDVLLKAQVYLGRAACFAAVGLKEEAAEMLEAGRQLRRSIRRQDRKVHLEWLDCRIAVHVGDLETAVPRLEALCRWFAGIEIFSKVYLCSLDLMQAYIKRGLERRPVVKGIEDLIRLAEVEDQAWALDALEELRAAIDKSREDLLESSIEEARAKVPLGPATEPETGALLRRGRALFPVSQQRRARGSATGQGAPHSIPEEVLSAIEMQRRLLGAFSEEP